MPGRPPRPTSWRAALEFITSEHPTARELRDKVVFLFTPMVDPDGCAGGQVRFNANGYDVNRHWDEVDLRTKIHLERMPEIWYVKKAILGLVDSGRTIDLFLNLHNTETAEYLATQASDAPSRDRINRFFEQLVASTSFDPGDRPRFDDRPDHSANSLFRQRGIPVVLMEQRIGTSRKLGRRPTVADRLEFGRAADRDPGPVRLGTGEIGDRGGIRRPRPGAAGGRS